MTSVTIIARARLMLQDTAESPRHSAANLLTLVNDGVFDLTARRPGLLLNAAGASTAFVAVTAATDVLPFDEEYEEAMSHYLAYRILEQDAGDEHNTLLSADHKAKYIDLT